MFANLKFWNGVLYCLLVSCCRTPYSDKGDHTNVTYVLLMSSDTVPSLPSHIWKRSKASSQQEVAAHALDCQGHICSRRPVPRISELPKFLQSFESEILRISIRFL
jgi:hypothetical protein